MKWQRINVGHYYTHARTWNGEHTMDIHVIKGAPGDWEVTINGEHKGYHGTKTQAQRAVESGRYDNA